ncbi:hypothetical protein BGX38DRAFT_1242835 [Terfezia claveryi]|nr:hypothetical protein BGX38DRAFT_1242835 [Terfezia claveryi]
MIVPLIIHTTSSNELSSSEVVTTGPLAGWQPRKGNLHRETLRYIQIANHPHHVCSALMTLARVHDLSTAGVLILLYPRHWDDDSSLGLARGIREEQLKLELRRKALQRDSRNRGAAAPIWVTGEYRPPQDQTLIFPGTWLASVTQQMGEVRTPDAPLCGYPVRGALMPVDPLPISSFFPRYSNEVDSDALPHEIHLPASGSLSSQPTLGLPMKNLDKLVTQLPPSTRIATPRTYWTHNKNRRKSRTVTPRATADELHIVAITGGWHGLGLAHDLANEVLEDVFSPSTALDGRWDPGRVREETHFVVFTGPRRPGRFGELRGDGRVGEGVVEKYAGVRRDVCLLDLEPVGKRRSLV